MFALGLEDDIVGFPFCEPEARDALSYYNVIYNIRESPNSMLKRETFMQFSFWAKKHNRI